ncbi:hypothetical protein MES4922_20116 [Mesorhizobium ventifaucium]|uniref:Uncharacterized protein n=1 Tax=Mesorhizobium ventifaucium TaxID=666020 RepID=A0ABM9DP85_9HYPH|nr:hypothetical protein MES4922_20116 [Mesorhizobium ventifaucium]
MTNFEHGAAAVIAGYPSAKSEAENCNGLQNTHLRGVLGFRLRSCHFGVAEAQVGGDDEVGSVVAPLSRLISGGQCSRERQICNGLHQLQPSEANPSRYGRHLGLVKPHFAVIQALYRRARVCWSSAAAKISPFQSNGSGSSRSVQDNYGPGRRLNFRRAFASAQMAGRTPFAVLAIGELIASAEHRSVPVALLDHLAHQAHRALTQGSMLKNDACSTSL